MIYLDEEGELHLNEDDTPQLEPQLKVDGGFVTIIKSWKEDEVADNPATFLEFLINAHVEGAKFDAVKLFAINYGLPTLIPNWLYFFKGMVAFHLSQKEPHTVPNSHSTPL